MIHGVHILDKGAMRIGNRETTSPAVMWAMSMLMREKYSNGVSGLLLSTELYDPGFLVLDKSKTCVQILFDDVLHFTTSSWHHVSGEVLIYDSLARPLTWQAKLQLWLLYGQGLKELRVRYLPVQDQQNGVDCFFFAAVFAHELSDGKDPCEGSFCGDQLRQWVLESLRNNYVSKPKRKPGKKGPRVRINMMDHIV